jgi:hypothetical protein
MRSIEPDSMKYSRIFLIRKTGRLSAQMVVDRYLYMAAIGQ